MAVVPALPLDDSFSHDDYGLIMRAGSSGAFLGRNHKLVARRDGSHLARRVGLRIGR